MDTNERRGRAMRRGGAEAAVDLRQRRAWFDGDKPEDGKGADKPAGDKGGDKPDPLPDWVKDPDKAYAEITKLRQESAQHRTGKTEAERRLAEREAAERAAAEKKLTDEKEWEKLATARATELEQAKARVAEMEARELRRKVADEVGLPAAFADRLKGATEADLKADAEALKPLVQTPAGTPPPPSKPNTTPNPQGQSPGETDEQRRARLYGGGSQMFKGGGVVMPGGNNT